MREAPPPRAALPVTSMDFRGVRADDMVQGYIHDRARLARRSCRALDTCRVVLEATTADGPDAVRVTLRLNGGSVVVRESADCCRSCLDLCALVGAAFDHAIESARRAAFSRSPRRPRRAHRSGVSDEVAPLGAPVAIHG